MSKSIVRHVLVERRPRHAGALPERSSPGKHVVRRRNRPRTLITPLLAGPGYTASRVSASILVASCSPTRRCNVS
jgi:hypothetical protein